MSQPEPLPFVTDTNGWVHECIGLDIPSSHGVDTFEWTIQKPARVFKVRAVPVHNGDGDERPVDLVLMEETELLGLWVQERQVHFEKTTKDGKPTTGLSWKTGMLLMPRDVVRIQVRSPVGCYLVGELRLAWLAN